MGGKSSPPPPDYSGAAAQQAASSREVNTAQTWANRPTQVTPFGTSSWSAGQGVDPATGQNVTTWQQNLDLTPAQQQALESQQGLQQQRSDLAANMWGQASGELSTPIDWEGFGDVTGLDSTSAGARQQAIDNAMQQFSSRADPRFAVQEDQVRTRLANQGVQEGSEAYNRSLGQFEQQKNDAYLQAQMAATQQGGAEGQRAQSMDVTQANYANQVRQQQMTEAMQRQGFTLNQINAILSGQQVGMPGMPSFSSAGKSDALQAMNAAQGQYGAALDASNASNAAAGQTWSTVGQVAGTAAIML